jgi:uncharacterized membrane protein
MRSLETSQHLIVECPFSRQLWGKLAAWPSCDGVNVAVQTGNCTILDFRHKWLEATKPEHRKGVSSLFILACWNIWRERNDRVFRDKQNSF